MPSVVVLSESMVMSALADPKFYAQVPELTGLKFKAKAAQVQPSGCRHCAQQRAVTSVLRDFIFTTMALLDEPRSRIKRYFGVEALMLNTHNPKTYQVEVKII